MDTLLSFLELTILGNRLQDYLVALCIFLGSVITLNLIKKMILTRLRVLVSKTETKFDDLLLDLGSQTLLPLLYLSAVYFSVRQLALNPIFEKLVNAAAVIILTIQITRLLLAAAVFFIEKTWLRTEVQKGSSSITKSIMTMVKIVIWGLGVVFILENLGFNISAVMAGLGIGGVAVALAAQTILGDLFNYFVIFFDRPFEEGDFIVFDDYMGHIENIGIKSTRIRALGGEQITISNSHLMGTKIRNYKRMAERRVLFKFGVIYETPNEKLKKIPEIVKQIIQSVPKTRFDRAHFRDFGSYSLDFEAVYFVLGSDFNQYADIHQTIGFLLKESFEKEKIEFAYPTQVEYFKEAPVLDQKL